MANSEILIREEEILPLSIFDHQNGEHVKSRGSLIEKKIDFLESLANKVSNRRSRRWLNDRLLIELVPRLNVDEIRGLLLHLHGANMIKSLRRPSTKRKDRVDTGEMAALNAWHRVDCRSREALRRNYLSELVEGYEECIRTFIKESGDGDVLVMHVQDPFHRLLLHGVCEFYDLVSVTVTRSKEAKITRINKKKSGSWEIPNMMLTHFLQMAKDGVVSSSLNNNSSIPNLPTTWPRIRKIKIDNRPHDQQKMVEKVTSFEPDVDSDTQFSWTVAASGQR